MKNVIYSCFGKKDLLYKDYLQMLLDEVENYKKSYRVDGLFQPVEIGYCQFIINSFEVAGESPSQSLFEQNFPETQGSFSSCTLISISDLRVYIFNLIDSRVNSYSSRCLTQLNAEVKKRGMTEKIVKEFNRLEALSNRNKAKDIQLDINGAKEYQIMLDRPFGLKTGIEAVDSRIGGMNPGTVTTIAGFTSQFKTTWAMNIAYINSYQYGYNIAYLSLETPKNDMKWNLISRHSYSDKFNKFPFIPHDKMRHTQLTEEEHHEAFYVVETDLSSMVMGSSGSLVPRGKVVIVDESDFSSFSFGEITAVLEKIDDELSANSGGLDAVIVDYVQLCKFSGTAGTSDANSQINSYITFFRRLGQSFRKVVDPVSGEEKTKQLSIILLAQLNRTGWLKASRNNGRYDMTALADANELERGSARVLTTFTTEDMKARNTAQVQILKNRAGQTMTEPATVFVEPAAYVFCDENAGQAGFNGSLGIAASSMESSFAALDSELDNMGDLGI